MVRVRAENTSQITMPATIRPAARSGYWGENRSEGPAPPPPRTACSSSSVMAGAHQSGSVEDVLMQIFHPGRGRAGDQQYQPQLCPGVSQQIDGRWRRSPRCRPAHRQKDQGQEPQTGPQDLGRAPSVAQSQMLR